MQSKATTVEQYLSELSAERRAALEAVRKVIRKNLDKAIQEGMQYGMIGYFIPHEVFPAGYHCDPKQPLCYAGLASQKNHMSLYIMGCYGDAAEEAWLREAWAKTGKKLDMGKACIRFKKLEDLPLDVVGEAFRRIPAATYIAHYQAHLDSRTSGKSGGKAAAKGGAGKGGAGKGGAGKGSAGQASGAGKSTPTKRKSSAKSARRSS